MRIYCRKNVIFRPLNILGKMKNTNLPVMIVQGDKDNVVPPENTRTWVDAMKEMGMKYEYVEVPGGDHGTAITGGMPNIVKFFGDHPKAGVQKLKIGKTLFPYLQNAAEGQFERRRLDGLKIG